MLSVELFSADVSSRVFSTVHASGPEVQASAIDL